MGAGKTTIAKKIAKKINYQFIDTDQLIEKTCNKSINEIFVEHGEKYFRNIETEVLFSLESKNKLVISCGGGLPCFNNNIEFINKNGISIYLKLSEKSLFYRLKNSKKVRPLIDNFNSDELQLFIRNSLKQREVFYTKAHHIIQGENLNIYQIIDILTQFENAN